MILFFYGEDTFRLKQKIRALKEKFISASLGDTNLAILDGKTISFEEIVRQVLAMPFLSKKRLVIIENFLQSAAKETIDQLSQFLKKVPQSTVLVFSEEGVPDRRTSLFRKLNQPGQAQEFVLLGGEQLRRWIRKTVEDRQGIIESIALNKLIEYLGNDLWRISNEIDKLLAYNRKISPESIELLVKPEIQANIFVLIEQAAAKNLGAAIRELYRLLNSNHNELYIWTMIIYQFRNLLIIKDILEKSPRLSRFELSKKTGLHPYVVQKTVILAAKYEESKLKEIYQNLLDFEIKIKTGKMEARVALELVIFRLCSKAGQRERL